MRKLREKRGFTLAELMVIVSVIGILSALAMPTFIRQLESTRARSCAELRVSLHEEVAYMAELERVSTDALADYITEHYNNTFLKAQGYVCPSCGEPLQIKPGDATIGGFSVLCPEHGGGAEDFDVAGAFNPFIKNGQFLNMLAELMSKNNTKKLTQIDSSAGETSHYTKYIEQWMQERGFNLGNGLSTTWSLYAGQGFTLDEDNATAKYEGNYIICWTSVDINKCEPGEQILVMRYNSNYKGVETYTAAWMTVKTTTITVDGKQNTYNIIQQSSNKTVDNAAEKDFTTQYEIFQKTLQQTGGTKKP